ncbi:apyrase [Anthonomus grandis grandis]|uniref:apyrase n=1 Tax=Anthonomus grandis grandis TaxID=2921223 RepID=UPI002166A859|nr:apyrase [Anthonomus grandis grandis]
MLWFSLIFLSFLGISASSPVKSPDLFELSVIHVNDFHARFDEVSTSSGSCNDPQTCIGGFSRLYTQIQNLLREKPKSLLLNGGDNFQGTLYYTLGKWNITQEFMNKLPFDATVLGNHEFDDGVEGVVPFIKTLKTPIVCANINDDQEPSIQGTYKKSVVVERDGKKIGIIGVIYGKTDTIANTGNLVFYPESASVNAEAERLVREEGVFTNIVLSHVGYDIDQQIAANASEKIGLIVGAHSHTFLYTGDNPPGPDTPGGPYPTIIQSKHNKSVLIVQASAYTKYLGNITVYYDSDGEISSYSGSPIFLENSLPTDEEVNEALAPWKEIVEAEGSVVMGTSLVKLSRTGCYYKECNLGNFVTDAFVFYYTQNRQQSNNSWTRAPIAIINAGGLRTDIEIGNITYNDLVTAQPFSNTVDYGVLQGKYIKELLEQSAGNFNNERISSELKLLQVSGIHVVYNISRPSGDRVVELKIRCQYCDVPEYQELDLNANYSMAVPSFITGGGDGFTALSNNIKDVVTGQVDVDVFRIYLEHRSPVFAEEEGRITVVSDHEIEARGMDL